MKLSDKILSLRKQRGLSQEELAEKLNVSRQAVSRWEIGSTLPDASNVLQLSKLFGVSADYLLNDEYEAAYASSAVNNPESTNKKGRKRIALFASVSGAAGNFILYILSRFIEVMVPHITYENGEKWYHWNSALTGHSYRYFIQEYDLEFLTFLFWVLFFAGLAYLFAGSTGMKKAVAAYREKRTQQRQKADRTPPEKS